MTDVPFQSTVTTWSFRSMKQLPSHDTVMTDAPWKQPVHSHDDAADHETPEPMICPFCSVQRPRREWTKTQWKQNSPVCFQYNACKSCSPCNLVVQQSDLAAAKRSLLLDWIWKKSLTYLKFMGPNQPVAGYPQMIQKDETQGFDLDVFTFFWATYWIKFTGQQQKTTWIRFIDILVLRFP